MNPRFRRLLIPGLLVALLVVVVVASIAGRAEGAEPDRPVDSTVVSTIKDPRITESSGLAVSTKHDDLAYTVNDSGNAPVVFAIRISTGRVVGTTTIRAATWLDTEALALRDGTLWVADTGDNAGTRTDAALYALPEPGRGDHSAAPKRYPVSYADGPHNVEAIAVPPRSGPVLLLSKGPTGGLVYQLPTPLRQDVANVATPTSHITPAFTTDATYDADGSRVLVRNYPVAQVRDARTWRLIRTDILPKQPLGETIALERSGRTYLVGSEGSGSALTRITFRPDAPSPSPTPEPRSTTPPAGESDDAGVPIAGIAAAGGIAALVVVAVLLARRRSRRS